MNAHTANLLPALGSPFAGGFFGGSLEVGGSRLAQVFAPIALGLHPGMRWSKSLKMVEGAMSFHDSRANTLAMAEAGSDLAAWALEQEINGEKDWAITALDVLELRYRMGKPTARKNSCWLRSGINLNACPPTHPYTPDFPAQTEIEIFREGGVEALKEDIYTTSTQLAGSVGYAWAQIFASGTQGNFHKSDSLPALLVRSVVIR